MAAASATSRKGETAEWDAGLKSVVMITCHGWQDPGFFSPASLIAMGLKSFSGRTAASR
jgi:hypothetical protein